MAGLVTEGKVVGWCNGRMEFGPRALGSRSIIGDARSPTMQSTMNFKIKYRESFRPFAPSVLEGSVGDYFEIDRPSDLKRANGSLRGDLEGPTPRPRRALAAAPAPNEYRIFVSGRIAAQVPL